MDKSDAKKKAQDKAKELNGKMSGGTNRKLPKPVISDEDNAKKDENQTRDEVFSQKDEEKAE